MTAATLTLTEFLEQRIAEDEAIARAASAGSWSSTKCRHLVDGNEHDFEHVVISSSEYGQIIDVSKSWRPEEDAAHIAHHDPTRVLAECAAKRAIVEAFAGSSHEGPFLSWPGRLAVQHLAAVYADHPDYRDEWRP